MVRETRHLWVGNLPARFPEDRIKEHFKRYTIICFIIYLMSSFFKLAGCPLERPVELLGSEKTELNFGAIFKVVLI